MNWSAFIGLRDRSGEHETSVRCPGCGEPIRIPRIPRGYSEPHYARCTRGIEARQDVREGVV